MIVCDTPESIEMFCLLSMRGRLRLEIIGLKFRGRTTYSIIKEKFGFRGSKAKVLKLLEEHINAKWPTTDGPFTQEPDNAG